MTYHNLKKIIINSEQVFTFTTSIFLIPLWQLLKHRNNSRAHGVDISNSFMAAVEES